jgi:predicted nucleotidyltransferase
VDLAEPARALSSGLTVPVLRALSRRTDAATAAQVWRAARQGTLAGVQRSCERLAEHGLVDRDEAAGRTVYAMNDDHVLYDAAIALLAADEAFVRRLTDAVERWTVLPLTAVLFGSAARGDGGVESDIDLLLVRPRRLGGTEATTWTGQVRRLRHDVRRWTGNRLDIVDRTRVEVRRLARGRDPLIDAVRDDGRTLYGLDVDALVAGTG